MELTDTQLVNRQILIFKRATIIVPATIVFLFVLMVVMRATVFRGSSTSRTCSLHSHHNQPLRLRAAAIKNTNTRKRQHTVKKQYDNGCDVGGVLHEKKYFCKITKFFLNPIKLFHKNDVKQIKMFSFAFKSEQK